MGKIFFLIIRISNTFEHIYTVYRLKLLQSFSFVLVWFDLVWFYATSTIVGYLKLNAFLYIQTVLFQTIQFIISTQFKYQNSSMSNDSVWYKYNFFVYTPFKCQKQFYFKFSFI